jgi:glycosyltransferase involved in cell wall biosynthesis
VVRTIDEVTFVSERSPGLHTRWLCCQLGAREHYAVPRALHRYGALELLFTDLWMWPKNPLGSFKRGLRERFHADLAAANVCALNLSSIAMEVRAKLASRRNWSHHRSYWQGRIARNASFQKAAVSRLSRIEAADMPRAVMAYSYMALQIFRLARVRGWRTVLGQIDPGPPEDRIVARLYEENPFYREQLERPPPQYWAEWREECALADRIVVNSQWSQAALEEEGVPATKIKVIPLAYETPEAGSTFQRYYPASFTPSRRMRVLFLGQINLRKGVGPLLDAIRLVRAEPMEFWFVGPSQIAIPADLRNNPQVRWIGPVSRAKTAAFYRQADLLVFPTFSDGFGLTQLEAQTWKLPIIATKFCGEVVQDRCNGWLLSEITPSAIATRLRSCLANPARLQECSDRCAPSKRFGLANIGEQWLHVFE